MTSTLDTEPKFGFYTVDYTEKLGWTGGYLLLNARGRPLEFHCTLPVRPTKSQEILYGKSLQPMLIGESIADAILQRARTRPDLLLIDQVEAKVIARRPDFHVLLVDVTPSDEQRLAAGSPPWERLDEAVVDAMCLSTSRASVEALFRATHDLNDLREPFERIREAIREAQQSVGSRAA